jgi:hypothetical protein
MKVPARCLLVMMICCALASACDEQPDVTFAADDVDAMHLLQLTDAQGDCASPRRVCYLTSWYGGTRRGCWNRERAYIHASFPDQEDKLVPVADFRATENATQTNASLD